MLELKIAPESERGCVHHWDLSDPKGSLIAGRCRRCGATRTFPAMLESTQRFDDYRELAGVTPGQGSEERLSA